MRITDRYQSLMDRVGSPTAARQADKAEKSSTGARAGNANAKPTTTSSNNSMSGGVEVNVSGRAQELAAGSARLDELKASIANGSFQINAQTIASRMLGEDA